MIKKLLSVVMVLVVFVGGYAALPKEFNPLPAEDVSAATMMKGNFPAGTYKVLAPFSTNIVAVTSSFTLTQNKWVSFKYGEVIYINSSGCSKGVYVGNQSKAYLRRMY